MDELQRRVILRSPVMIISQYDYVMMNIDSEGMSCTSDLV